MTTRFHRVLLVAAFLSAGQALASRPKEPLEAFDLQALVLFEIVQGKCELEALITDPNGYRHRVFKGTYVGRHGGVVVDIAANKLTIKEFTDDSQTNEHEVILVPRLRAESPRL